MNGDYFREGVPVSLEQILDAREVRAAYQKELLNRFQKPLISFKMNIPGEIKVYPLAERAFADGCRQIESQLVANGTTVLYSEKKDLVTGTETYWIADGDAAAVKLLMMEIEERDSLGRLYDIDVLEADGGLIKGTGLGRPERTCIICGRAVWECARSRNHTAEMLAFRTAEIIREHYALSFADQISAAAVRALLYEVSITPKPGLVDRVNNGAHSDMNYYTFIDSSCALITYFRETVRFAANYTGEISGLLDRLGPLGRRAEKEMFVATGGVNTQKGLIFSLGLFCAAAGYLYQSAEILTLSNLLDTVQIIAAEKDGVPSDRTENDPTHGMSVCIQYGISGIRGEASKGFPCVRKIGYPVLKSLIQQGVCTDEAGAITLLLLIAATEDTNIIYRAGLDEYHRMKADVTKILEQDNDPQRLRNAAVKLDADFTAKG
ncbi:MAG: citrate lyase holo-[acyl-carrier protein] synthase, partial [Clostridiales Family XIII bacterium]|nr:citrate lyase holo-[acyl-carrier protein] synthase [Clostridiales Family XIII bacterium]